MKYIYQYDGLILTKSEMLKKVDHKLLAKLTSHALKNGGFINCDNISIYYIRYHIKEDKISELQEYLSKIKKGKYKRIFNKIKELTNR